MRILCVQYIMEFEYKDEKKGDEQDDSRCTGCRTCCGLCCGHFMRFCAWLYTLPFEILRYCAVFACFAMPCFILYCY